MKAIVPIDNFKIEKTFTLGSACFVPANEFKEIAIRQKEYALPKIEIVDNILAYEFSGESLRDLGSILTGIHAEDIWNMTVVVLDIQGYDDIYFSGSKIDDEELLIKTCDTVNSLLDIVRVEFSRLDNALFNPGLPGLLNTGYSGMIIINPDNDSEYRIIGTRIYSITMVNGLGLDLSESQIDILNNSKYLPLLNIVDGHYSNMLAKLALRRLSEAMYIPLIDSKFIYLMTTLETLASKEYIGFKKVKPKIVPLLVRSKEQYHLLSEELKVFSEDIRTEIIHNGKSLKELRSDYKKVLIKLQSIIARLAEAYLQSNCGTEEELEGQRIEKMRELGVI